MLYSIRTPILQFIGEGSPQSIPIMQRDQVNKIDDNNDDDEEECFNLKVLREKVFPLATRSIKSALSTT